MQTNNIQQTLLDPYTIRSVIDRLPNPFGTFEKATYSIELYNGRKLFSFVTTCRDEKNCIEILKERIENLFGLYECNSLIAYKTCNGVRTQLFYRPFIPKQQRKYIISDKKLNNELV
jgi:hypothetical protein